MLLTRNTRFTQQTLMQPLYVTIFIMLRGYLDEFQIAGAKNATQQIRNRLGAPTRNMSSSGAWPDYEGQEMEDHITQLTLSGDFNRVFTRFQQPIIPAPLTFHGHLASLRSSRRPIMVSKVTKNGTQDTLDTQKWSLFDPKTVNFGYG